MAGRALPMLVSAVAGIALGSIVTALLTAPPDHRGEMPAVSLNPPQAPATPAAIAPVTEAAAGEEMESVAARQALAARLRSPDALRLKDVRIHDYGTPDERAVCGTMLSPEISGGTARFVVRVLQPRGTSSRPLQTVVEDAPWLVRPSPEAARRFCREPEPVVMAQPESTASVPGAPAPVSPVTAATATAAGGRVTTQSPANLRAAPSGEVLSSIPRGRTLIVFDRAPGGWLQVGETAPQGWVHSSLLSDVAP